MERLVSGYLFDNRNSLYSLLHQFTGKLPPFKHYILSNILLVFLYVLCLMQILGMCFFIGGMRRPEQLHSSLVAPTSTSMMAISIASLLIPAAFHATFTSEDFNKQSILKISCTSSIILLLVYFSYSFLSS